MNKQLTSTELEQSFELTDEIKRLANLYQTPLNPTNFKIWYHYLIADNSHLTQEVDSIINSEKMFDYYKFCQASLLLDEPISKLENKANQSCLRLQDGLGDIIKLLKSHLQSNEGFVDILDENVNSITEKTSPDQILNVLKNLVVESAKMQRNSQILEKKLGNYKERLEETKTALKKSLENEMKDALTLLPNRRFFDYTLEKEIVNAIANNSPMCLAIMDIDNFKLLNDNYGHLIGDDVLKYIGSLLLNSVKGQDTPARYGGEEFGIILPNTEVQEAVKLLENIREKIASSNLMLTVRKQTIGTITASFGVAQLDEKDSREELIHKADVKMYTAKETGKNRIVY